MIQFVIDIDLFHFLRPNWLWLFLPMFMVVGFAWLGGRDKQTWKKHIEPHLLPYVINKGNRLTKVVPLISLILALSCIIIAISGPTWKKIEVPGSKSEAILLIAMDLSPSMLAEDVSPNRLERAKFKVRDLIEAKPGVKIGLIAFSGTSHPVVTPCSDYQLVSHQLQSLIPQIMPVQGTDYDLMLELSDTILNRTEAPSTLLLVTDVIDENQAQLLKTFVNNSKHQLEIITIASTQGVEIPGLEPGTYFQEDGVNIISKLNKQVLFDLQNNAKININPITLGNEDMVELATKVKENMIYRSENKESDEDWEENGFFLLWIVLVILALWFRKGWMVSWCVLILILPSCSDVDNWDDLWYQKDYQGQQSMNEGEFMDAAQQFESFAHKGVAFYKSGDYESAIEVFKQDTTATSMYNLGLSYAANGQNDLAQEALQIAERLDPSNESIKNATTKNNREIRKLDSIYRSNADSLTTLPEKEEKKEDLNERKASSPDEELSADNEVKELPKDGNRVTDEEETGTRKAEEMDSPPEDFQSESGESPQNILLREISADPSEFLKRRFKYQKDKYYPNKEQPKELW